MSVISVLATAGDCYGFVTYCSEQPADDATVKGLEREVVKAAILVHGIDPSPRRTFVVHEAA